MLTNAVKRYQNGLIDSAQVMEELFELSKKMKEADKRGETLSINVKKP